MKPFHVPERRPCIVRYHEGKELKEKRAFFHLFTTRSDVIAPSPLKGGHHGGQVSIPVAIVEFEDGEVYEVEPHEVHFLDTYGLMKQYLWEAPET